MAMRQTRLQRRRHCKARRARVDGYLGRRLCRETSTITISETDGTWEQRSDFLADDCAESSKTRTDRVYSTFKIADASQWEGSAFASSETIVVMVSF